MKKFLVLCATLLSLAFLVACADQDIPDTSTDMLLSVEINPAIEFIIDEEEKVKSYRLINEDAEIVGAGLNLNQMHYEEALQAFLGAAVDTGYIDVTRADQAVALMAVHHDEEVMGTFRETVQTRVEAYLEEHALGVVVLNHGELDEALITFADTHDVSIGFAKMALSYMELNPEAIVDDVLSMSQKDLMDALVEDHQQVMNTYRNQKETEAQAVKNELKVGLLAQVQAHKDAVDAGTKTQPDLTGVKAQYMSDYEGMKAAYQTRNQERKEQAKAKLSGEVPHLLSLDINPALDMIIDADGYVYSVMYKNEDAEIVGSGVQMIGLQYELALTNYLGEAVEAGYIDVTRPDNAVAMMTGTVDGGLEEQFRVQVQTMLQTYFQENALGVVVINKAEVNDEISTFAETNDVTFGFAKLVLAYLEANPEVLVEDALQLSPFDMIESVAAYQVNAYTQFQNEREDDALMIKNEMKIAIQAQVQAHKDAVDAGTKTQPDITGVAQQYLNNYQQKLQSFVQANEARKEAAKEKVQEGEGLVLSIDINPSIEFVVDPQGYVLSYMYKNEDAEIVGAGLALEGLHYELALQHYLDAAVDTGYLDLNRNDNALIIQTSSMNEGESTNLMVQVQTKLQTYFEDNCIGAVVLNHGEISEEVQALVEQYEISVGHAKLIISYLELYPDEDVVDLLLLPIKQLVLNTIQAHHRHMETYRNERQLEAQAIKDELADALMSQVQAHHQAVSEGTITQPDTSGVKEAYLANFEQMHQAYVQRNQSRVEEAKNKAQQGVNP